MDMFYVSLWTFPTRARDKYLDTKKVLPKYSFQHKMKGFEIVKDPEAYSEPSRTSKTEIFKKYLTAESS